MWLIGKFIDVHQAFLDSEFSWTWRGNVLINLSAKKSADSKFRKQNGFLGIAEGFYSRAKELSREANPVLIAVISGSLLPVL